MEGQDLRAGNAVYHISCLSWHAFAEHFLQGQASIGGTDSYGTVWQGHWRTHYLPSCLVAQMAIAVLYLLRIIITGWRALLDPARFDTSGL
jgi:hypothetical protein